MVHYRGIFTFREKERFMNTRMNHRPVFDVQLIDEALASLQASTGIASQLFDDSVTLHVADRQLRYSYEVKRNIDRVAILDDLKARTSDKSNILLISTPLTSAMAERCHELDIQFIDTAGNAFIRNRKGILISVTGRKLEKGLMAKRDKAITPAALRMMFAFLAQPSMLNAPYREISVSAGVSAGAIGSALQTLETRGMIGTTPAGRRIISSPELMLSEWATGYTSRMRPKQKKFRFSAADPTALLEQWNPEMRISAWGGEVAAEKLTRHLNPLNFTIYLDMNHAQELTDMVKRFKLRADPLGKIEIVQPFWNMDFFYENFPSVPLHLIYADLLGTNDSRNLVVAKQLFETVVLHVHTAE
jgi:hypothetical protein